MRQLLLILTAFLSLTAVTAFGQTISIIECTLNKTDSSLCWTSINDTPKFAYIIQQYKWDRWVNWDTIISTSTKDTSKYSQKIPRYIHSGLNQFRVKGNNTVSKTVKWQTKEESDFFIDRGHYKYYDTNPIVFKRETYYELYDKFGKLLKSGYEKSFYINDLTMDAYYLNYENKNVEIIR